MAVALAPRLRAITLNLLALLRHEHPRARACLHAGTDAAATEHAAAGRRGGWRGGSCRVGSGCGGILSRHVRSRLLLLRLELSREVLGAAATKAADAEAREGIVSCRGERLERIPCGRERCRKTKEILRGGRCGSIRRSIRRETRRGGLLWAMLAP